MKRAKLKKIEIWSNANDYSSEFHFTDGTVIIGGCFKEMEDFEGEFDYMNGLIESGLTTEEIVERCEAR